MFVSRCSVRTARRNSRLSSSLPLSTAMRWMQTVNETHNHWVVTLQLLDMALHTHSPCILWETSESVLNIFNIPQNRKREKNNKVQIMRKKQFLTFFIIDDVKCVHIISWRVSLLLRSGDKRDVFDHKNVTIRFFSIKFLFFFFAWRCLMLWLFICGGGGKTSEN